MSRDVGEGRPEAAPSLPVSGLLHLLVIYIIWGSTYLAIRVAVREGSGFPPFTMGALRTILGGAVLLLLAACFLWPRAGAATSSTAVNELESKMKNCC